MKVHYTTATTALLLIPLIVVLVVLNEADNRTSVESNVGPKNDQDTASQVNSRLTSGVDSDSQCDCNCDRSLTTENAFGDQVVDQTELEVIDPSKRETPTIFIITPTYSRPTQMADMTRLSQTLSLVDNIFWIVSEDSHIRSLQVAQLLNRTKIPFVHLLGPRPNTHLDKRSGRGVSNRLKSLEYLRQTYSNTNKEGVLYFADDDNAYDIRIFEEIRNTKTVSMFPVGLIAKIGLSTPVVSKSTGKIIGFHDPFISRRKYAVDMAGFAVNLQLFLSRPRATMPYKVGYEEDYFIRSLGVHFEDLEPKANNCTQILVWHTKTTASIAPNYTFMAKQNGFNDTNLPLLYDTVLKNA